MRILDRVFGASQVLIMLVVLARITLDLLPGVPHPSGAGLAPIILFLGPLVYAVYIFATTGSLASAIWLLFLMTLDVTLLQRGLDRWSNALEIGIIGTLAVFAGRRVEREIAARRQAMEAEEARQLSEAAYRALFAHSQTAIFIVGDDGSVRDASVAAQALFAPRRVIGQALTELFGADQGRQLLGSLPDSITLRDAGDTERILCPISTAITIADRRLVQLLLRDVTEERRRQLQKDSYTTYVLRGEEEQRRQLARELHDEPIQALISVCHRLDAVPHRAALPAETLAAVEQARARVEQTVQGLRDLARGLRPSTLDDLGLVFALQHLIDTLEERTGVKTQFRVHGGEHRLAPEVEAGLFRIAQEALRNVERHAAARRLLVDLTFARDLRLEVRDDGRGFDVQATHQGSAAMGLGLLGLRERATLLQGRIEIRAAPGNGTAVIVCVPIDWPPDRANDPSSLAGPDFGKTLTLT